MGEVWRARDTVIDRVVAIKVLSSKLSKDEEFQRRFRREAHAAARLETPMSCRFTTMGRPTVGYS